MEAGSPIFDNRELALLSWIAVVAVWLVLSKRFRPSLAEIGKSLRERKVIIPIVLTFVYGIAVVWLLARVGFWTGELFSETLFWLVGPGIALLFGIATRERDERFLRKTVRQLFTLTVVLTFVLNLQPLPLAAELLLLPALVALAGGLAVAEAKPDLQGARPILGGLLFLIGVGLLIFTVVSIIRDPDEFITLDTLRGFLLPIILTLSFVPYLYLIDLYASYEKAFVWTNFKVEDRRRSRRAKLALASKLWGRTRDVRAFNMMWSKQVVETNSLHAARQKVAQFRAWVHEQRMKPIHEQERLAKFAGVEGVDDEGRQLDQREFKETKDALQTLATSQMGWYRNRGKRYRTDVLKMILTARDFGLPEPHGIEIHVAKNGKSWWAWRRTITGWCFGIGAVAPPPDEWMYEGLEPPNEPPGENHTGWSRYGTEAKNW